MRSDPHQPTDTFLCRANSPSGPFTTVTESGNGTVAAGSTTVRSD
jgi:hypothetical protein